jgi:broad specificity phosphatase PhoE
MNQTLLYVARHGRTSANAKGLFRGNLNPDLDAKGRADAEALADYFKDICLAGIFYSDKKRSTETAEAIARCHPNIPCYATESLWPWNVGMFSGQPKSPENLRKLEHYIQNPGLPIPNGESLNDFKARIRPCLMEGMELANKNGAPVLFVVHSSVIHEAGSMIDGDHNAALVEPGGIAHIYTDGVCLKTEPLFKTAPQLSGSRADTVS